MWKKILFIYNPVAGRTQIREYLPDIIDILSAADFKVLCYPTRGQGDARRVVRERQEDYLYVVCAGGDGTLDEVVSGMMENPDKPFVPIGYIPAGTTNDFASSLHIPTDMRQAAQIIAQGRTFRCDLGLFNKTDYFTYVAAFGIFTGTSYQTPQELKNQIGHLAYIFQGVTELGNMRAYNMHVEAEGTVPGGSGGDLHGRVIDGEFALGMITNSQSIGGFANITGKRVDLQDGLFEVTLVRMPKNPLELSEILFSVGNPDAQTSMIYSFKASRVTLECEEQVAWTRDGEFAGSHRRVTLENSSRQLRILVPEEHADSF
ncbi:MAG: diacylglycerol kinase family lipid kinase [Lachnospiraceae bacterium]|nr:diacylglycerol kinase family lipid kinase [Lachnospiraceae bacterium]